MKVPRTFTVLYRSQTATNAQHRANGFDGYFFSSFRNKSHTGRHAAKQGANLAVQLEMLMRVIAKTNHFTDDELEEMRREAVNNVRRTRGKIKLEDIAKGWYNEE